MSLGDSFLSVLAAARTGAEWAWTVLYQDLAPAVLGYLRAQGSREPEDLTSEVFVAVVRGLGGFTGDEAAFRSWVFVIAHRRLLDERRRGSRIPHPMPADAAQRPDPGTHVEDDALRGLVEARVQKLIQALAPAQRDVLMLRIVGGLTVEEVARALGKRPGAVKAVQRRGLAAIERNLSKEGVPL